jgi:hypothetical protein
MKNEKGKMKKYEKRAEQFRDGVVGYSLLG